MAVVFNIQRFGVQDGPGIRTTVFIKGCPLRCLWCSNPESQSVVPEIACSHVLCRQCGRCIAQCEAGAISFRNDGKIVIDQSLCTQCGKCVDMCPSNALRMYGKEMTVNEVFDQVVRDKDFYRNSGGGVTVSGGEPLTQPDFVGELFKKCWEASIDTCLDTCGYADHGAWRTVLPFTDLVLLDVKHVDAEAHRLITGRDNEKVVRSLEIVAESSVPVIVRIPIIPGMTDSESNVRGIARFIGRFGNIEKVNLLPFHRLGVSKYTMLGRQCGLENMEPLRRSALDRYIPMFEEYGIRCEIEG